MPSATESRTTARRLLSLGIYSALVLVTGGYHPEWTPEDLAELRKKHPELDNDALWK